MDPARFRDISDRTVRSVLNLTRAFPMSMTERFGHHFVMPFATRAVAKKAETGRDKMSNTHLADAVERHDSAKRRQIMQGARLVFLAQGFDGASMGEIARQAGVSKGTLYVYFDSKEALFEAIV